MYASKHPLEPGTLVIELRETAESNEILELHGQLLSIPGLSYLGIQLLGALESFNAGTPLDRFHRHAREE